VIIAILQARMGSTRLPGKSMKEVEGKPLLWHVIQRLKKSRRIEKIVVATTEKKDDEVIVELAKREGAGFFQGSEGDVLDRYYHAAKKYRADIIVRVTADCPLLDPQATDRVIEKFLEGGFDYVSNTDPPTYPDGLDTEVFSFAALERAWTEAKLLSEREHVTPYMRKNQVIFRQANVMNSEDLSKMRWTVDERADLEFTRRVYLLLGEKGRRHDFTMEDVLKILKDNPDLHGINAGFERNEGYAKSLREDKKVK
jgi:spore coat polysaccharide biosynthesis protein SpsF (cytidylyltransferase family)